MTVDTISPRLDVFYEPQHVQGSMDGAAFGSSIVNMPHGRSRELAIFQQLSLGNIPSFLRRGLPISVTTGDLHGVFWVMPDYLSIGSDEDYLRMPMQPGTAQKAANLFGACLPTRKMVNDIWRAMPLHFEPRPMGASSSMASMTTIGEHNALIQKALAGRPPEVGMDGHKKTVVLARNRPKKNVAIYGWHRLNGNPIQGPQIQMSAHTLDYLDYSHGIRWVHQYMLVNGEEMHLEQVLTDPELHLLVSDEGPYKLDDCYYDAVV